MGYGLVKREGVLVLTDLDVSELKIKRIERAIDQSNEGRKAAQPCRLETAASEQE